MDINNTSELKVGKINFKIFDIVSKANEIGFDLKKLPYSLRILFENTMRSGGDLIIFKEWLKDKKSEAEVNFCPSRVLMQDFTGVPAIVDLAAMRDAVTALDGDSAVINPLIPVDLVIDHSVQVDYASSPQAFTKNVAIEIERNIERYRFLKWGQKNFTNFRVVPPGTGICHQVNLEYLSKVVWTKKIGDETIAYPDSLVGTDSHTTMVNGLSVLGWGVGGIEAEAAMLGQALPMILPEVVGFKLTGKLTGIITATDLVLKITQVLREFNVVGKFVEFFGPGLENLTIEDRATISNMAPEYGATCSFFPIDDKTIKYLKNTGRSQNEITLVEIYAKAQNLWADADNVPEYTDVLELDLSSLKSSIAGPKRPQDLIQLDMVARSFRALLKTESLDVKVPVKDKNFTLQNGDIVIAAITSCTNTSNPAVMIAAGLLAKAAVERGLTSKPWIKTSLAPGSKVVSEYYQASGLDKYLDSLGFNLVGYGCTTCIGNSGPLDSTIEKAIVENNLTVAAVLSGNRNFEGRVHPLTKINYLMSPPLVIAYAIAGSMKIDLTTTSLGLDKHGMEVYLKDIWPTTPEINSYIEKFIKPNMFSQKYGEVFNGDEHWQNLSVNDGNNYQWDKSSTYIKNPPYFARQAAPNYNISKAKILAIFGDSITTDHISPAGNISRTSPAAAYLLDQGVLPKDFNSYGARRGNHEVMMRGTFANIRIKNKMCSEIEGGYTINQLNGVTANIFEVAMNYKANNIASVIFAGKEYGTGSSRDWAAKGPSLLGVKAIIAESFERIHRSNLIGMGVLPLKLTNKSLLELNLIGNENINILILTKLETYQSLKVEIIDIKGKKREIDVTLQLFTDNEIAYLEAGSIMHYVVNQLKIHKDQWNSIK